MKAIYQLPTREPPRPLAAPPWPAARAALGLAPGSAARLVPGSNHPNQQFSKNKILKETNHMKKDRKKQDDRLLKRLPLQERRVQERLRHQILAEKLFLAV